MNTKFVSQTSICLIIIVSAFLFDRFTVQSKMSPRETPQQAALKPDTGSRAVRTIPFELSDNLIYLEVQVNGSKPLPFVLDTGAPAFVIDPAQAKALKLKTEGQAKGTGGGAGTYDYTFTKNVSYTLPGGIAIPVPSSYVIDLSGLRPALSHDFIGLVGLDLFNRYVVEINYDAQVLRLFEPQTYTYSGNGEVVPITIEVGKPHIVAKLKVAGLEPVDRNFLIDSGSGDAVDDDLIAQSSAPKIEISSGVGLGQRFKAFEGPVEWLKIGRLTIEDTYGNSGGRSLIGGAVLRRFTVIFDYSRKQMILESNQHFRDEFSFDMSGINLLPTRDGGGFVIDSVLKNSPAAEVGLREGDIIISLDGMPSEVFNVQQMRRMFSVSKMYYLGIKRGNEVLQIPIKLRSLL